MIPSSFSSIASTNHLTEWNKSRELPSLTPRTLCTDRSVIYHHRRVRKSTGPSGTILTTDIHSVSFFHILYICIYNLHSCLQIHKFDGLHSKWISKKPGGKCPDGWEDPIVDRKCHRSMNFFRMCNRSNFLSSKAACSDPFSLSEPPQDENFHIQRCAHVLLNIQRSSLPIDL